MTFVSGVPLTQGWLVVALYGAAALERGGVDDAEYLRFRGHARRLGLLTTTVVLIILALMVAKPF